MNELFSSLKQYVSKNSSFENKALQNTPSFKDLLEDTRTNILNKKGLLPPKNLEENIKHVEKKEECDYIIDLIHQAIRDSIQFEKEKSEVLIDKNKLKHLRYENFNTCLDYHLTINTLNDMGITSNVYKNNKELYFVDFSLFDKKLDIYH